MQQVIDGYGRHEAIIEHPNHRIIIHEISEEHLASMRRSSGQRIFCSLIDEALTYAATIHDRDSGEIRRKVNVEQYVIERGERFVAINPFVSRFDWEIHVLPLQHESGFLEATEDDIADFARAFKLTMARLDKVVGGVQFNFLLHSLPHGEVFNNCQDRYHRCLEICPRTSIATGFELGSGLFVSTVSPEEAAGALRNAEID